MLYCKICLVKNHDFGAIHIGIPYGLLHTMLYWTIIKKFLITSSSNTLYEYHMDSTWFFTMIFVLQSCRTPFHSTISQLAKRFYLFVMSSGCALCSFKQPIGKATPFSLLEVQPQIVYIIHTWIRIVEKLLTFLSPLHDVVMCDAVRHHQMRLASYNSLFLSTIHSQDISTSWIGDLLLHELPDHDSSLNEVP